MNQRISHRTDEKLPLRRGSSVAFAPPRAGHDFHEVRLIILIQQNQSGQQTEGDQDSIFDANFKPS